MIIVDLIRELMFQQRKTIGGVSQESGVPYEIIEDIIIREITPKPEDAKAILGVLGVKLEDVLCLY